MGDLKPDIVLRRLGVMRTMLSHLERLDITSVEDLDDLAIRYQLEHILASLVNLATEINGHIAKVNGVTTSDYREGFSVLARLDVIEPELARALAPSVGLRNVITHQYVDLDAEFRAFRLAPSQYGSYIKAVAQYLETQQEAPGQPQ